MQRQDIADYLGLTIETVSRTFTHMKERGLIALPTTRRVEILNPERSSVSPPPTGTPRSGIEKSARDLSRFAFV